MPSGASTPSSPEKEPPRWAAQVREETPKEGGNTERHVRCCTAQFNVALHKCKGGGRRGAMHHRLEPVTTNRPTRKSPALGRASKSSAGSVWGLRGAATLIGVALSLLDGSGGLISRAQRYFCNALVGVDHLLKG